MTSAAMLDKADKLFRAGDPKAALDTYLATEAAAQAAGDASVQTEALAQAARMYSLTGRLDEGRQWLARAAAAASPAQPLGWSRYLGVRGIFERESNQKEQAIATFKEMYEFCRAHGLHSRAVDAAHHVGIAGGLDDKIEWGLKGIREAEAGGMTGWLGPLWNNLGNAYDEAGRFQEALNAFLKARDAHAAAGNPNTHIGDWAVAKAYRKMADAAHAREYLALARTEVHRRESLSPPENMGEWNGWCAWEDGEILLLEGKRGEAMVRLRQGLDQLIAAGIETWGPYFANMAATMEERLKILQRE